MTNRPDQFAELDDRAPTSSDFTPPETGDKKEDEGQGTVPRSRLDEVLKDRNRLEGVVNEFTLAAMRGSAGQDPQPAPTPAAPQVDLSALDNLDEDAAKDIMGLITSENQRFAKQFMAEFQQAFGPALEGATKLVQRTEVSESVEGFDEVKEQVAAKYQGLDQVKQAEYNTRVGVESLTLQVQLADANKELESLRSGANMAGHRGAITPANRGGIATPSELREPEVDPWGLSEDQFEDFKRSQGL